MVSRILDSDDEEDIVHAPLDDRSNNAVFSDDEADGETSKGSPHGRKRARVREDGKAVKRERASRGGANSASVKKEDEKPRSSARGRRVSSQEPSVSARGEDEDEDEERDAPKVEEENRPKPPGVTQPRDKDGYVPGSIVRIKLAGFLTYDNVEFKPGPYLNMILGPNGTGKSSIACAICLGLGFPPSNLGRATELSAFVKHGSTKATIEIELKGPPKRGNIIIERTLNSKSNSTSFKMNGVETTKTEVVKAVAALNVQVENLCSFLPQDRVAEFARLTPQELLKKTQLAAGASELTAWHQDLIKKSSVLKTAKEKHTSCSEKLTFERGQNERTKIEVEKFQQRKAIQSEIDFWELAQPYVEYLEAYREHASLKEAKQIAHARLNELLGQNAPLKRLVASWQEKRRDIVSGRDKIKRETTARHRSLIEIEKKYTRGEKEFEETQREIDILSRNERERLEKLRRCEKQIEALQKKIDNPPKIPETDEDLTQEMSQVQKWLEENRDKITKSHQQKGDLVRQDEMHRIDLQTAGKELHELTNEKARRIAKLKDWDPQAGAAAEWLEANRDKFKMEVFQPLCVSVNVRDRAFQTPVESCVSYDQMRTFVTQCEEDYQQFNALVNDNRDFAVNGRKVRVNVWYRGQGNLAPAPLSPEQMRDCGFDSYALDKVTFPDGLGWYLRKEVGLHRTPIAIQEGTINPEKVMHLLSERGGGSFIGGMTKFNVQRSQYGQRLAFMTTSGIRDARNFVGDVGDPETIVKLQKRVADINSELHHIVAGIHQLEAAEKELNAQKEDLSKQKEDLKQRREAVRKAKEWVSLHTIKLEREERARNDLLNAPSVEAKKAHLKSKQEEQLQRRTECAITIKDVILNLVLDRQRDTVLALQLIQVEANIAELNSLSLLQTTKTQNAQEVFNQAKEAVATSKAHTVKLKDRVTSRFEGLETGVRERFDDVPREEKEAWTAGHVADRLEHFKNALDANFAVDAGVVEAYKRRLKTIEELETEEAGLKTAMTKIESKVQKIHGLWYPALKELITSVGEKFSAAFDRIGCAGEIRINEVEDYDQWTLDILVKFRDTENLQILTGHRQSGGERSLTTILYLMSLTEYARAPFSLVDEINQGMDSRAERAVHDQLVEVTCTGDAGQYFLITPKLLPDLRYHKRMRILCVNNGEWLPDDDPIGNLKSLVSDYASHRASKS